MVVHRPDMSKNSVEVYIGKVKYKWMGKVGMKEFDYNYQNGRFKGKDEKEFVISGEIGYAF
jgi:hypothetical protein